MVQGVAIEDGSLININPATGELISKVPCSNPAEIAAMVKTANEAQTTWAATKVQNRVHLLRRCLKAMAAIKDEFARLIVQEMGKPIQEACDEMDFSIDKEEFLTILEQSLLPQKFGNSVVLRQPLGVVAIISPWNFPVGEIILLVLPSLASGNSGKPPFFAILHTDCALAILIDAFSLACWKQS